MSVPWFDYSVETGAHDRFEAFWVPILAPKIDRRLYRHDRHTAHHADLRPANRHHPPDHSAGGDPECHGAGNPRADGHHLRPGHRSRRAMVHAPPEDGPRHL